jgi:hypothetical protein
MLSKDIVLLLSDLYGAADVLLGGFNTIRTGLVRLGLAVYRSGWNRDQNCRRLITEHRDRAGAWNGGAAKRGACDKLAAMVVTMVIDPDVCRALSRDDLFQTDRTHLIG